MRTTQTGTVERVEGGRAVVRLPQPCAPQACSSCGLCGAAARERDSFEIEAEAPRALAPGDHVRVQVDVPHAGLVSLMVFGIPLGSGLLGGVVASVLGNGGDDLGIVIGGAGGLAAGFGLVAAAERLLPGLRSRARVLDAESKGA